MPNSQELKSEMDGFKKYSEEQIASYLEGTGEIDDMEFLNALIQDKELSDVTDALEQMDMLDSLDSVDNIDNTK